MDVDVIFCRTLLKEAHAAVKARAPTIDLKRDAWVWHAGRGHWEFHGPDRFYWHGRAANAYDARYKGWMAWLEWHSSKSEQQRAGERPMARIKLTKALIYAAATDAAERSKRKRGLAAWDQEASDAYCDEFNRLFEAIGGAEGWIDLPRE